MHTLVKAVVYPILITRQTLGFDNNGHQSPNKKKEKTVSHVTTLLQIRPL